jgi:predicted DNA-binding protein (MmcQ/YjbR family)
MHRRADAVEKSYESLVKVLTEKNRLELIANVSRFLNREIIEVTLSVKGVFESLEKINEPTLQLVAPSYYLLAQKLESNPRDSTVMKAFRANLLKYL